MKNLLNETQTDQCEPKAPKPQAVGRLKYPGGKYVELFGYQLSKNWPFSPTLISNSNQINEGCELYVACGFIQISQELTSFFHGLQAYLF